MRDGQGNESTSVAFAFSQKRECSARMAELPVTSTFTAPRRPAALRARNTNLPSD